MAAPTRLDAQALGDAAWLKRLTAGEVLVSVEPISGSTAGKAHAAIEIALPPIALWAILLDCNKTLKFVRRLKSCRVTSADPGGRWDVREHVVEWLWPLPTVRSVFRSDYIPFERIRFIRIEGDLKELAGEWRLMPMRNGRATLLSYEARVDPGVALPGVLIRGAIESELRETLTSLRREATGGG